MEKKDDFQASFYGPLFDSESSMEEVTIQINQGNHLKKPKRDYKYLYVEETHKEHPEFKYNSSELSNQFRYYIFTNMDKNKYIPLHTSAAFGDKYFCTFMILEAEKLKFADDIIDKKGG